MLLDLLYVIFFRIQYNCTTSSNNISSVKTINSLANNYNNKWNLNPIDVELMIVELHCSFNSFMNRLPFNGNPCAVSSVNITKYGQLNSFNNLDSCKKKIICFTHMNLLKCIELSEFGIIDRFR